MVKRILIPVDFSARSSAALAYGVGLARLTGATIDVLHVIPAPTPLTVAAGLYLHGSLAVVESCEIDRISRNIDVLLSSISTAGVTIAKRIEIGSPAATTVRIATEDKHDLVIIGTHGRVGVSEFVLGSVAKTLVSSAPCPVLTLREDPHEPTTLGVG